VKIATFNINGLNGRLPVLLRWLAEAKPDVVCLQELKAQQGSFPQAVIHDAGESSVKAGPTRSGSCIRASAFTPSGIMSETRGAGTPGCASTTYCSAPTWPSS